MAADQLAHESSVDAVASMDGGLDQGLCGELVDGVRSPLGGLKDSLAGVVGKKFGLDVGALEMEGDVVSGVGGEIQLTLPQGVERFPVGHSLPRTCDDGGGRVNGVCHRHARSPI